jgi:cytochrome c553
MKIRMDSVLLAMVVTAYAPQVSYAGDPVRGKVAAGKCAGCHGITGIAKAPNYPNLAGQKEAYLVKAIKDYRAKLRKDPVMGAMVAAMTEEDIEHVAAYFSSQPAK